MAGKAKSSKAGDSAANIGFEAKLWLAADKLRNNMDAAEYKHVVLGLIFLKYISDSFEEHHARLIAGEGDFAGANPEDKDEYLAANVFWESNLFSLYWAAQAQEQIVSRANGSTFLEISKANSRPLPIVKPPRTVISAIDKQVNPLYARVVSNERATCTLAALRDALLPKLLSGEIRVGAAKRRVGGVGQ